MEVCNLSSPYRVPCRDSLHPLGSLRLITVILLACLCAGLSRAPFATTSAHTAPLPGLPRTTAPALVQTRYASSAATHRVPPPRLRRPRISPHVAAAQHSDVLRAAVKNPAQSGPVTQVMRGAALVHPAWPGTTMSVLGIGMSFLVALCWMPQKYVRLCLPQHRDRGTIWATMAATGDIQRQSMAAAHDNIMRTHLSEDAAAELKHIHALVRTLEASSEDTVTELRDIHALVGALASERLDELQEGLDRLGEGRERVENALRIQRLQWAMSHADLFSFKFNKLSGMQYMYDSRDIVKEIIGCWMKDYGYTLAGRKLAGSDAQDSKAFEEFRDKLSGQLHSLTGIEPRWTPKDAGRWTIWEK